MMHTDEFEISLARELKVCNSAIKKIQKFLSRMEEKYTTTTKDFAEGYLNGKFSANNKDYAAWFNNYEALSRWERRRMDFKEIFYRMKI